MAKGKKKKKSKDTHSSLIHRLLLGDKSSPVRSAILGVLIAAIAGFLILAAFGSAGFVGEKVFGSLGWLFGSGYWFFVIGLIFFAYALLRQSANLPKVTWVHSVSALVLFVVILGLIDVASPDTAGFIGGVVAGGVVSAFSIYAGVIILQTIAVISLLILIDGYINLNRRIDLPDFLSLRTSSSDNEEDDVRVTNRAAEANKGAQTSSTTSQQAEKLDTDSETTNTTSQKDIDDEKDGASNFSITKAKKNTNASSFTASPPLKGDYTPPPVELLSRDTEEPEVGDVKARANLIKRTLENFNINVEMDEVSIGPTVTRYALKPAEGVKLNKITNLQNNLELALAAHPVRIEAPIPGKSLVGIEVPNTSKTTVGLAGLLGSKEFQDSKAPLLMGLGQGISGEQYFADLNKMPHLLIGGATGAGKSVTVHALMNSLLYRNGPDDLKLIMVDPKRVELTLYNGIPHLLTPVIKSAKKAILALKWAAKEMDRRYDILEECKVQDISSYHKNALPKLQKEQAEDEESPDNMPYIVIVIDEMADLMSAYPKELEAVIVRIAQMSRAVGIHLILSTQRPDVSVITGIIKANIPARIALQVSSQIDSRTILDTKGAEQLLGAGDMLYQSGDMSKPVRIQSAFITEGEIKKIVSHLKNQYADQLQDTVNLNKDEDGDGGKTIFDVAAEAEEQEERDDKYEEALETVVKAGKASTSHLQRKLRVGYSRAARIIDELEENGIISEKDGTRARDVLITREQLEKARSGEAITHSSDEPTEDGHDSEDIDDTENGEEYTETAESTEAEEDSSSSDEDEIDDKYFDALDDSEAEDDENESSY